MERQFLNWVFKTIPSSPNSLIGNGDDCAVINQMDSKILVATDMLLDGIHFNSAEISPELIGRKAVAVNFSDIAAMGGSPLAVFVSLALPKAQGLEWLQKVMLGAQDISKQFNCGIDGGDTNTWTDKFAINVCVIGSTHWRGPVPRGGAQDGDIIMVTGQNLGGSLRSGHHAHFTPRLSEAKWILDRYPIHSMIDLSDGLATDVKHLALASKKQFTLSGDALQNKTASPGDFRSIFCDGEDFELLFTCSPSVANSLSREFPWPCGLRTIGSVSSGEGVFFRENDCNIATPLEFSGYEH
ncbi:MAG: thiamine-phosphate kinase [bacterium]